MSPETFKAWRKSRFRSQREAAVAIGKSVPTIARYETAGVPPSEELTVRLAMAAIAFGLPPWPVS